MLLPLEIFDLIIDDVAAEQRMSKLMTTCSLVCHYFHSRARIHIFSHIYLPVGTQEYCRKRAKKFLKILKYKKNADLISHCIRSVIILVQPCVPYWDGSEEDLPCSNGFLKLMGIDRNPIKTVLTKFNNAPIQELVLNGSSCYPPEFPYIRTSGILLLMMCSNPNLKTLRFEYIKDLPLSFIRGSSHGRGFTRLALQAVTIRNYWGEISPTVFPAAARIETLELVEMTSDKYLKVLDCLCPPPKSVYFQNLKNMVVTFQHCYSREREEMWNVIFSAARTLESLEIRLNTGYAGAEPNFCDIRPLRLGPLKSLQRLKITSARADDRPHFDDVLRKELTLMALILASSTSPIHVRSVILETSFLEQCQQTPSILMPDKWLSIDAILASSIFLELHTVEVTVKGYPHPGSEMQQRRIDFMDLLPTISSQSWISLMTSTTQGARRHTAIYEMYPYEL